MSSVIQLVVGDILVVTQASTTNVLYIFLGLCGARLVFTSLGCVGSFIEIGIFRFQSLLWCAAMFRTWVT
ncbi:MAG: hypothetical protein DHS20C11_19820 [Lysobacteraceae bacterium]|nr:MAG: hypothetical protein DHS20C11_19820 [Xanthomonadaceae bacterium]